MEPDPYSDLGAALALAIHHRAAVSDPAALVGVTGFAVGHAVTMLELGSRAYHARDVEHKASRLRGAAGVVGLIRRRLEWGGRRTSPSSFARKEAAEQGWPCPYPLADVFEPERELRAAGLGATPGQRA